MAEWWHVIELPDGTTTPGSWDLRPLSEQVPWPDLSGKRCLDIGTADGFWAFEMERRGAAEVVATDVSSPFQERSRRNFEEAHAARASSVRYDVSSVFELEGEYDVAFMGYVLQMVEDPIRALRAVSRVARTLLLLDTVSRPLSFLPSPLARLDARRDGREWFVFNTRGMRKVVELAGWTVEAQTGVVAEHVRPAAGDWRWRTGVRGRSCVLRARRQP
jgi:2-polyprenyl-3-methyl-5-hydroxy-6-metoxy-1,4-benzoquinol methylase